MFDKESLKPVILSMIIYLIIAKLLPEIIKKPTGITIIDDLNMMLIAQKGALSSGAILTGIVAFITHYVIDQELM
mgnify:CR=1 FL=1|jgi:hypothetical protein